jgi:hypothetical protein
VLKDLSDNGDLLTRFQEAQRRSLETEFAASVWNQSSSSSSSSASAASGGLDWSREDWAQVLSVLVTSQHSPAASAAFGSGVDLTSASPSAVAQASTVLTLPEPLHRVCSEFEQFFQEHFQQAGYQDTSFSAFQ